MLLIRTPVAVYDISKIWCKKTRKKMKTQVDFENQRSTLTCFDCRLWDGRSLQ